jgi:hypothetical protein
LEAVVFDERRLHRVQPAVLGQASDGRDLPAFILNGKRQKRDDPLAVD